VSPQVKQQFEQSSGKKNRVAPLSPMPVTAIMEEHHQGDVETGVQHPYAAPAVVSDSVTGFGGYSGNDDADSKAVGGYGGGDVGVIAGGGDDDDDDDGDDDDNGQPKQQESWWGPTPSRPVTALAPPAAAAAAGYVVDDGGAPQDAYTATTADEGAGGALGVTSVDEDVESSAVPPSAVSQPHEPSMPVDAAHDTPEAEATSVASERIE
jgi:hypothetical protein